MTSPTLMSLTSCCGAGALYAFGHAVGSAIFREKTYVSTYDACLGICTDILMQKFAFEDRLVALLRNVTCGLLFCSISFVGR